MDEEESARMETMLQMVRSYQQAREEGVAPENLELEALLSAMKQAESNATNVSLSGSQKPEEDAADREEIIPKPFFVVKTVNEKKQKVFINMCASDKIPGPEDWEEGIPPSMEEALADENESTHNIRLPLSCSDPVVSSDHCGRPCLVHDVVYNMSVVEAAMRDKRLKVFMINTAMSWISQKYNAQLTSDFKLPNMKYKGGSVQKHYIRAAQKGPLISEIPDVEVESEPAFPLLAKKNHLVRKEVPSLSELKGDLRREEESLNLPQHPHGDIIDMEAMEIAHSSADEEPVHIFESKIETDETSVMETIGDSTTRSSSDVGKINNRESMPGEGDPVPVPQAVLPEEVPVSQAVLSEEEVPVPQSVLPEEEPEEKPRSPAIRTEYLGLPVEYIFIHISFPPEKNLENLQIFASNNEVYFSAQSFETISVPLMFPASPENAKAEINDAVVTVKLPYLGVKRLYCCGDR